MPASDALNFIPGSNTENYGDRVTKVYYLKLLFCKSTGATL